ncbi:MAG: lysophospholipase, partial [Cyanobacteria bacterium P01_A01_bin.84]
MQHHEDFFQGGSSLKLYYQSWYPENQVRAALIIVHGLGGHCNLYQNIIKHLIPKNYAIYAFDLPGNGRSPGLRGHINDWNDYRESLQLFVQLVTQKEGKIPLFVFGHSLGGLISLDYILRLSPQELSLLSGLITLAPAVGKVGVSPIKLFIGKVLSQIIPTFTLNTGIDLSKSTRDKDVLATYAEDDLRHRLGSARLSTEFMKTTKWVNNQIPFLKLPLLILHGDADEVAPIEVSYKLLQKVNFPDKELIEYPGAYHEIQNDLCYPKVVVDIENWLEQHLSVNQKR